MPLMFTVSLGTKSGGSVLIRNFSRGRRERIVAGLVEAGSILESGIKMNLSGPSHTRFPGNGNPYPGTLSHILKNSVRHKVDRGALSMKVGPGSESSEYSAVHVLGSATTPKRDYMTPAWEKNKNRILNMINQKIMEPIR